MNSGIPVCGEGDSPVLVAKRQGNRWFIFGINGVMVAVNYRGYHFPTYEAAAGFAREWYGGLDEEFKRLLFMTEHYASFRGETAKDGVRQRQRLSFIAKRHGGRLD